jgi:hypothetical protein
MEDPSDELQHGDDEGDYIPASLASFVAQANKNLADATSQFHSAVLDQFTSPDPLDRSMEEAQQPEVVLIEDEEDVKLKQDVLEKLEAPQQSVLGEPSNLFEQKFSSPQSYEEPPIELSIDENPLSSSFLEDVSPIGSPGSFQSQVNVLSLDNQGQSKTATIQPLAASTETSKQSIEGKTSTILGTSVAPSNVRAREKTPSKTPEVAPTRKLELSPESPTASPNKTKKKGIFRVFSRSSRSGSKSPKGASPGKVANKSPASSPSKPPPSKTAEEIESYTNQFVRPNEPVESGPEVLVAPESPFSQTKVVPVVPRSTPAAAFLPTTPAQTSAALTSQTINDADFLPSPSAVAKQPSDADFLPNSRLTLETTPTAPKPSVPPATQGDKTTSAAEKVPTAQNSGLKTSVSRLMQPTASSATQSRRKGMASGMEDVAKARDRVRHRMLADKSTVKQTDARKARVHPVSAQSAQARTMERLRQKRLEEEAQCKAEEERRRELADKVRSYGSGRTIPRGPRLSTSTRAKPVIKTAPELVSRQQPSKLQAPRTKSTTPKPFHFHGPEPFRPAKDVNTPVSLAESTDQLFWKGLRHTTPVPKLQARPKLTTPKPFTFHETKSHFTTLGLSEEERKRAPEPLLADRLKDFDKHLRESIPLPFADRDLSKPTVPVSPKFTPITKRARAKSTEERDKEMMDYYQRHKFKAAPIMTRPPRGVVGQQGIAKVPKKKLTEPKPFRFATDARLSHCGKENETNQMPPEETFHARLMPNFAASTPHVAMTRRTPSPKIISPRYEEDEKECEKQFRARAMPQFGASKLTTRRCETTKQSVPHSLLNTNSRKIRVTIAAPTDAKSPRQATTPKPFNLSSSNRKTSPASVDPDTLELQRKFKALSLPRSTFVRPSLETSKNGIPSTIVVTSPAAADGCNQSIEEAHIVEALDDISELQSSPPRNRPTALEDPSLPKAPLSP